MNNVSWRNPPHEAHVVAYQNIIKGIPVEHQVSWLTDDSDEYVSFSVLADAQKHLARMKEIYEEAELRSFNSDGDWIEFTGTTWHIVDTEPADDGYDYDKYY